jgi:hypothetical protein
MAVMTMISPTPWAEDEPHQPKDKEYEEESAEAAKGEETEERAIAPAIRITISIHWWDGNRLSILAGLLDGLGNFRGLRDSLRNTGAVDHIASESQNADEHQGCDQPEYKTIIRHFYLQW